MPETPEVGEASAAPLRRELVIAELSNELVSMHTPEGVYTYASPACRDLLGYEPEELVGRSAYEFIHPQDFLALMARQTAEPDPPELATFTYRIRRRDGTYIPFETRRRTIREAGTIRELVSVSRALDAPAGSAPPPPAAAPATAPPAAADPADVLARRIFDASADGILAFDRDLRITAWSPAMEALTGVSEADALEKRVQETLAALAHTPVEDAFRAALLGKASEPIAWSWEAEEGPRHLEACIAPLPGTDGVQGGVAMVRAVVRMPAPQPQEAPSPSAPTSTAPPPNAPDTRERERYEAIVALQARFAAATAQELRTPTAPMRKHLRLLETSAGQRRALDEINAVERLTRELDRLTRAIDDIADVSQLQAGALEFAPAALDLSHLLERVRDATTRAASRRAVEMNLRVPQGVLVAAENDRLAQGLRLVVETLVAHVPKRGTLAVDADVSRGHVALRFSGMAGTPEALAKRFEPFDRPETPDAAPTTGPSSFLGRAVVALHGGDILVFRGPDDMPIVVVRLPAASGSEAEPEGLIHSPA